MNEQARARPGTAAKKDVLHSEPGVHGLLGADAARPSPNEALLVEKYREALEHHLNHLPSLFHTLTGLSCRVSWAPTWPHQYGEQELPFSFPLCRCLMSRYPGAIARCRKSAMHHLKLTLRSGHAGHRFTCPLGVHNCWQPVIVRQRIVGLAFIQALDTRAARESRRQGASRTGYARSAGRACRAARRMTRAEFARSSRLLQLIFEHAETLTLAEFRKADVDRIQRALMELQTETTRLREDLNGLIPTVKRTPPELQEKNHSEQIVHDMLNLISRDYAQPITLKQCAKSLKLNTAYLSTLFSRHVGLPFKAYLTNLRLEKSRELLSDTRRNISDIALEVGYASENRFRSAFKKSTGLAPTAWRETLRTQHTRKTSPPS